MPESQLAESFENFGIQPTPLPQIQPDIERMSHSFSPQLGECGKRSASVGADENGVEPVHLRPGDALVLRQVGGARGIGAQLDQHLLGRVAGSEPNLESGDDGIVADALIQEDLAGWRRRCGRSTGDQKDIGLPLRHGIEIGDGGEMSKGTVVQDPAQFSPNAGFRGLGRG